MNSGKVLPLQVDYRAMFVEEKIYANVQDSFF